MGKRVVIALGGNALGNNLPEQMIAVKQTARAIVDLIEEGHEVIIAHGNGPQVGMIQKAMAELTRSEPEKYIPCPLSVCVAMSQGYIGYDLQNALREELLYGSLWAGLVLNAMGTAYPHPFGYILTEDFGIPHGMACAVFLPSLSRRAEAFVPARAQRLFTLCGGREAYYGLLEALIDAPVTMTEEAVQAYAARWEGLKNLARTPGGFTVEEGRQLFRELFVPRQEA